MTNCSPRPRMRWSVAIGATGRCKRVSTVYAPKSRSRHALHSICGEKPKAKVVTKLCAIAQAALDTVFFWGLLGAGGGVSSAQLSQPSFIFEAGMKAAKPIADFDTWFRAAYSAVRLVANPTDLISYWLIIASFAGITLHTMMMLIEYHLAVMLASVLIPWGIWRLTSGIAEFSLGG